MKIEIDPPSPFGSESVAPPVRFLARRGCLWAGVRAGLLARFISLFLLAFLAGAAVRYVNLNNPAPALVEFNDSTRR